MSGAPQLPPRDARWEAELAERLAAVAPRWSCPGASLAAIDGDRCALVTFGTTDVEDGRPVEHETCFQIGSVTKPMTATLVMQAVEEGRLALDDDVAERAPELSGLAGVSVRRLLDHTSGISGDDYGDYGSGPDAVGALARAVAARPRLHEPGATFSYCNNGFGILGRLLELAYDAPFASVIEQRLFGPLGLATASASRLAHDPERTAHGHVASPGEAPQRASVWTFPYAGGPSGSTVTMSAADLARFGLAHCDGGALAGVGAVLRDHAKPVGDADVESWALGWCRAYAAQGDAPVLGHSGDTRGQQTVLRFDPAARRVLAFVANASNGVAVASELLDGAPEALGWARTAARREEGGPPPAPAGEYRRHEAVARVTPMDSELLVTHEYSGSQAAVSDVVGDSFHVVPAGPRQWWSVPERGSLVTPLRVFPGCCDGAVHVIRLGWRLYRAA